MALYGDLEYDSRVRKEATALAQAGYEVSIVCLEGLGDRQGDDLPNGIEIIEERADRTSVVPGSHNPFFNAEGGRIGSVARRARWLAGYTRNLRAWGRRVPATVRPVDVWHLHDFMALAAVGPRVLGRVPVVYDAHDLFLESGTTLHLPGLVRQALRAYEGHLLSQVAAVLTVNDSLADVLGQRYRPRRTVVVHNCPDWTPPALERPTLLRDCARIPAGAPIVLYHGSLTRDRGIEQLLAAMLEPGLDSAHLVLLGFGAQRAEYAARSKDAHWAGRVHVLPAVPPTELLDWVASADVGAVAIQKSTLNHYLSTPNKLFESIAAGVPVIASDFPTMRRIVVDNPGGPLGVVCDPADPRAIARAMRAVLDLDPAARAALRERCLAAARERWNWATEASHLVALYDELTSQPTRPGHDTGVVARTT
jgi:glycosyltransferase involved in cell wall biosynthesis